MSARHFSRSRPGHPPPHHRPLAGPESGPPRRPPRSTTRVNPIPGTGVSQRNTATANVTSTTTAQTLHYTRRAPVPPRLSSYRPILSVPCPRACASRLHPSRSYRGRCSHARHARPRPRPVRERRAHAVYGASAIRRRSKRARPAKSVAEPRPRPLFWPARPRLYAAPARSLLRITFPSYPPSLSPARSAASSPTRPTNQGPPQSARRRWCKGGGRAGTTTTTRRHDHHGHPPSVH